MKLKLYDYCCAEYINDINTILALAWCVCVYVFECLCDCSSTMKIITTNLNELKSCVCAQLIVSTSSLTHAGTQTGSCKYACAQRLVANDKLCVCFLFEFLGFCFSVWWLCVRFNVQCAQCGKIGETNALDLLPNELFVTLHICASVCVCVSVRLT